MAKLDLKKTLNHDVEEIWVFLEQHGVLRILVNGGIVRLLMQTGINVEVTPKGLEALLAQDRARLRQEAEAASGKRTFMGYRTTFDNLGHGQMVQTSDPTPHFGIVGRDQKRLNEINAEWRALFVWKADIQKALNFVLAQVIEIPPVFLPENNDGKSDNSKKSSELAIAKKTSDAISWCVRTYKERKVNRQPLSQSGIAGEAMRAYFPDIAEYTDRLGKTKKPLKNKDWLLKRDSLRTSFLQKLPPRGKKK